MKSVTDTTNIFVQVSHISSLLYVLHILCQLYVLQYLSFVFAYLLKTMLMQAPITGS